MASFDRGFKSWAERTAASIRSDLGLSQVDRLDILNLASLLNVTLCTPRDIPGLPGEVLDQLFTHDPWGWSAVSITRPDGGTLLIYNPEKSPGRMSSDIGHELSHVIQDHKPSMVMLSHDGSMAMRTYDQKREEEADWLAWCLLLPREGLIDSKRKGLTTAQIAERYGVTERLVKFRLGITGVSLQLRRRFSR